jgi:hypothetical protein
MAAGVGKPATCMPVETVIRRPDDGIDGGNPQS